MSVILKYEIIIIMVSECHVVHVMWVGILNLKSLDRETYREYVIRVVGAHISCIQN